jgi:hypothetical protein
MLIFICWYGLIEFCFLNLSALEFTEDEKSDLGFTAYLWDEQCNWLFSIGQWRKPIERDFH